MELARIASLLVWVGVLGVGAPPFAAPRLEASAPAAGIPRQTHIAQEPLVFATAEDPWRFRRWTLGENGLEVSVLGAPPQPIRLEQWIVAHPWHACAPGMVLRRDGSVVVSSNVIPRLYVVDARTFEVTLHDIALAGEPLVEIGFTDLREGPLGPTLRVRSALDYSVWIVNLTARHAIRVRGRNEGEKACQ